MTAVIALAANERAIAGLKLSTLAPLAHDLAKSLSGGQRMLLQACAGFMIPGVAVHVLDEPFAANRKTGEQGEHERMLRD